MPRLRLKRVMPGRILAIPAKNIMPRFSITGGRAIIVDASTSGGTGGAPLINLHSGELIGMNLAGSWQNIEQGKFSYSSPIQWMFPGEKLGEYLRQAISNLSMDGIAENLSQLEKRDKKVVIASIKADKNLATEPVNLVQIIKSAEVPYDGYNARFLSTLIPLPSLSESTSTEATDEIKYVHHSVVMNKQRRLAFFAAENVDGGSLIRLMRSQNSYQLDPRIDKKFQIGNELYKNNILDRGHLARRSNLTWGARVEAVAAEANTFIYTNTTPQLSDLNRRSWVQLEDTLLDYVDEKNLKANFYTGPIFRDDDPLYRNIKIPRAFWKIMVTEIDGIMKSVAYIVDQDVVVDGEILSGRSAEFDIVNSQVSIVDLEVQTGLDFGPIGDFEKLTFD